MSTTKKKRLLFLDDEEQILSSLRVALRRERKRWSMRFCSSGEEALAALAEEPADLIVTDMRMPEMNGAEFLERVTAELPNSVRVVLSGEAEESLTVSAVRYAHQWINKPTETAELVRVLDRALKTSDLTQSSRAHQIVTSVATLPVLPQVYQELTIALADGEVSLDVVCELVQRQPSVSARVLQMSNSAFFGLPRPIGNIREAVGYLGLDTLKSLVFAAEIISELGPEDGSFPMPDFLVEAAATSKLAGEIMKPGTEECQTAISAGLLHDIGRLVLVQSGSLGHEYARECNGQDELVWMETEQRIFGATHAEVGGALLGVWGLPHQLVEAVAYHHDPDCLQSPSMDPVVAVHIARAIVTHELRRAAMESDDVDFPASPPDITPGSLALLEPGTLDRLADMARAMLGEENAKVTDQEATADLEEGS